MNHYDILVIGGGPGGMGAALRAAELGRKTALVERAELGGVCLNWGCIPTKALLKSAQVYHYCRTADAFGVTLGGEAKPDMARIVARSRGVSETMRKGVGFLLEKNKVDVLRGEARLAGEGRVIVADETVSADHIILATGARPREMSFMPIDHEHVLSSRDALVLDELPESMVVVGSGAIGCEFASFYAALGVRVTVVEYLPQLMPLEDEEVARTMERAFRKQRIAVMTSTTVKSVTVDGEGRCRVRIEGKKGVLWWSIYKIIQKNHPSYVLLENVDRLLKSPASQRGRDFGIILKCLQEEGYGIEWRVINAADYGCVQRRRRTFIFAFKNTTKQYERMTSCFSEDTKDGRVWLMQEGFFAHAFPVHSEVADPKKVTTVDFNEYTDTVDVTNRFRAAFYNSGVLCNGKIFSLEAVPNGKEPMLLGEIVVNGDIDKSFFIEDEDLEKWKYMKGAKTIERTSKTGYSYTFSEGPIAFPDPLDRPGRTMLTSEGTKNRSSHAIIDPKTGKLRILLPEECERMNGFPTGWTDTGMPKRQRYFIMGNALVVPLITQMGKQLLDIL